MRPLNGTKTHPLTEHAKGVLRRLRREAVPSQEINPGVVNRLCREHLAEIKDLRSPYAKHKGARINHLVITAAGRAVVPLES